MEGLVDRFKQLKLRPWSDFLDTERFKPPENMEKLQIRLVTNLNYYAVNYLLIALGLFILAA
jgi:uncharacterized membrane protein